MTSRSDVLTTAERLVNGDRDQAHGQPAVTFGRIAALWSAHLGITVTPAQVAQMMILFKVARLGANPVNVDSWVDVAGYAACGCEIAAGVPEPYAVLWCLRCGERKREFTNMGTIYCKPCADLITNGDA